MAGLKAGISLICLKDSGTLPERSVEFKLLF